MQQTAQQPSPRAAAINGIDVSKYQGRINWQKVASAGQRFAIVRTGWGGYAGGIEEGYDPRFVENITGARAAEAVKEAREAGFKNLSLDLMLGIPYQTADFLRETLEKILALYPDHLSCYLLKIEPGTPFARRHAGIPQRRRADHTVYLHRLQPAHRHPLRTVRHRPDCHHPGRGNLL